MSVPRVEAAAPTRRRRRSELPSCGTPPVHEPPRSPAPGGRDPWGPAGSTRTCQVLASDGHVLVHATGYLNDDRTVVAIEKAAERGVLLAYYFLKGDRRVEVLLGLQRHAGLLSTRWDGGRRVWRISLDEAVRQERAEASRSRAGFASATGSGQ